FFFSSRRRHTSSKRDWSSDVCSSDLPKQIAFNVLPHIDVFMDNGYTKEEMKMVWETLKILGDDSIPINPTAARVPVFYGHSEARSEERRVGRECRRGWAGGAEQGEQV